MKDLLIAKPVFRDSRKAKNILHFEPPCKMKNDGARAVPARSGNMSPVATWIFLSPTLDLFWPVPS
jgi:hypothetical protein